MPPPPPDWLAEGVRRGSHAGQAKSTLRPSLCLRPLPALTLPRPSPLLICVYECERKGEKREFERVEGVS